MVKLCYLTDIKYIWNVFCGGECYMGFDACTNTLKMHIVITGLFLRQYITDRYVKRQVEKILIFLLGTFAFSKQFTVTSTQI